MSHFRYPEETADFRLEIEMGPLSPIHIGPIDYSILDTDYKTFAIVWTCQDVSPSEQKDGLWILARTPQWTFEDKDNIHLKLKAFGLDPRRLKATDNSDC
jgi:lipocalin